MLKIMDKWKNGTAIPSGQQNRMTGIFPNPLCPSTGTNHTIMMLIFPECKGYTSLQQPVVLNSQKEQKGVGGKSNA